MWIVRLALRRPYTFAVAALVLLLLTSFVLSRDRQSLRFTGKRDEGRRLRIAPSGEKTMIRSRYFDPFWNMARSIVPASEADGRRRKAAPMAPDSRIGLRNHLSFA
jgi:hypothetical protein